MTKKVESSYLRLPKNKLYRFFFSFYEWLSALTNPLVWLIDSRSRTLLDVGCGQGYPLREIKMIRNLEATGIDLYDPYIKEARSLGLYREVLKGNVADMRVKEKSFDTVMSLQVIEHLKKKEGLKMIKKMESIAKYQVIIATPYHFFEHPEMDRNKLQKHLSHWNDQYFKDVGYNVRHVGLEFFFGNTGVVHKKIPKPLKAGIFVLDKILMPFYWFVPGFSNYWVIAYKNVS